MSKTLIGSRALRYHFPDSREPNDWDYITNEPLVSVTHGDLRVEYHNTGHPGHQWILEQGPIASPQILLTIKMSHAFWDVHWAKTMNDIKFLQHKGVKYIPELFELLHDLWTQLHGTKKAKLTMSNEDFFVDNVSRIYVHDELHKAVAYYDKPLYTRIKVDQDKAHCSYELFKRLNYADQLKLCREEIYVTALERFLIPTKFGEGKYSSYIFACKKLLTSMSKGWFPKFIVENWLQLYKPDDHPFIKLFKEKESTLCKI